MSRYLVDRIAALPNVEVVTQARGDAGSKAATACCEAIRWRAAPGDGAALPVRHLFLFIGAEPTPTGSPARASRSTPRASC